MKQALISRLPSPSGITSPRHKTFSCRHSISWNVGFLHYVTPPLSCCMVEEPIISRNPTWAKYTDLNTIWITNRIRLLQCICIDCMLHGPSHLNNQQPNLPVWIPATQDILEQVGDITCVLRFSWSDEMKSWRCKVKDKTYIFAMDVTRKPHSFPLFLF
jgi:hypothetical protein